MTRERVLIVSDLHMATPGGPYADPFRDDAVVAAALDGFAHTSLPTRLVLLGDIFDFVLAGPPAVVSGDPDELAIAKLDAIASAHPGVFAALARFARAGHALEVVPGNHDSELLRRAVQDRLSALLGGARLTWRPWFVHIPGVLYAEHGQQHHDLNHIVGLLDPLERDGLPPSPAACLEALRVELARIRGRHGVGTERVALAVTAGACRLARSLATIGCTTACDAAYEHRLREHAAEAGLPADALVALHRASKPRLRAMALRLGASAVRRARGAEPPERDVSMLEAARRIDDLLHHEGPAPAFYVFGHSHVARSRRLCGRRPSPRYLSAGAAADHLRFIEIEHGGGMPPVARMHSKPDRLPLRAWVAAPAA